MSDTTLVYTSLKLKGGVADALNFNIQQANEETLNDLFRTMKQQVKIIIDRDRKSKYSTDKVSYTPGKLAETATYKVTSYAKKGQLQTEGTFSVGKGLPYAWIHDRDGITEIRATTKPNLYFFNHTEGIWTRTPTVDRPGSPYFDEAYANALKKLGMQ